MPQRKQIFFLHHNLKFTMQEELDMSRLQVKQLNDLVSEADEIVKV